MRELYIQTPAGQMQKLSESEVFYRDEDGKLKREQRVDNIAEWYSNQDLYKMHIECQKDTRQELNNIAINYADTLNKVLNSISTLSNRIDNHNHFNDRIKKNTDMVDHVKGKLDEMLNVAKGKQALSDSTIKIALFIFAIASFLSTILGILNYFK